jgi:hypothetical protein
MRILLFLIAGFVLFAASQASAEEQKYLTVRKGNNTHIVAIDPVTASILEKSMREGKRIKINLPNNTALHNDDDDYCNRQCRKERREARKRGYNHSRFIDD